MICNNVNHNPDALGVGCTDECFELISSAEVRVDSVPVTSPVAVVSIGRVIDNRADPNCVKTHASNVVQLVLEALEGTTTVVGETSASVGAAVGSCETVGQNLVD